MNERIDRLQKKMQEEGLQACLISDHSAVDYFIQHRFSCGERLIALIIPCQGSTQACAQRAVSVNAAGRLRACPL